MAEWRDRGYVPDSDEDDEDSLVSAPKVFHNSWQGTDDKANPKVPPGIVEGQADPARPDGSTCATDAKYTPSPDGPQSYGPGQGSLHLADAYAERESSVPLQGSWTDAPELSTADLLDAELQYGLRTVQETLSGSKVFGESASPNRSSSSSPLSSIGSADKISLTEPGSPIHHGTGAPNVIHVDKLQLLSAEQPARSLRQRNPIQLHPYAIEDARYQQQWKSRGLRPLRVPDAQGLPAAADTVDSQEQAPLQDSQQSIASPKSTAQDISQSPVRALRNKWTHLSEIDADELPETSDLLQRHAMYIERKNPPKSRLPPSAKQDDSLRVRFHNYELPHSRPEMHQDSLFDVPPSPPQSDDVNPEYGALLVNHGQSQTRRSSFHGLPTPVPSSGRRGKRTLVEVSSSSEASQSADDDPDEVSTSYSESQSSRSQPHALHSFQRKIKGVLPASWLKLDLKGRMSNVVPKGTVEPGTKTTGKGVARPVDGTSRSVQAPEIFDISDGDASGAETQQWQPKSRNGTGSETSQSDHARPEKGIENYDDVMEDDTIDLMLPSLSQRRYMGVRSSSRTRQPRIEQAWNKVPVTRPANFGRPISKHRSARTYRQKRHKQHKRHRSDAYRVQRSVLDAPGFVQLPISQRPSFLRIAGRSAYGWTKPNGHRLQTPDYKVFQFTSAADTEDVTNTLKDWMEGRLAVHHSSRQAKSGLVCSIDQSTQRRVAMDKSRVANTDKAQLNPAQSLATLKESTIATLRALSHHHANRNLSPSLAERYPTQPFTAASLKLRALHGNRKRLKASHGMTKILSDVPDPRPAQLEQLQTRPLSATRPSAVNGVGESSNHMQSAGVYASPHVSTRETRNVPEVDISRTTMDALVSKERQKRGSSVGQEGTAVQSLPRPLAHVSRKQEARRLTAQRHERGDSESRDASNTFDVAAIPLPTSNDLDSSDMTLVTKAVSHMTNMSSLTPGTRYSRESWIGSNLARTIKWVGVPGRGISDRTVEGDEVVTIPIRKRLPVAPETLDILRTSEINGTLFESVFGGFEDATKSSSQSTPCIRFYKYPSKISERLSNSDFIQESTCSVRAFLRHFEAWEGELQLGGGRDLRILNRLTAVSFQIAGLAQLDAVDQTTSDRALSLFTEVARLSLSVALHERGLQRLFAFLNHNQSSLGREPILQREECLEAETIVMLRHFYETLVGEDWPIVFNKALQPSTYSTTSSSMIAALTKVISIFTSITPLMLINKNGHLQDVSSPHRSYSAWEVLTPAIEACLRDFHNSKRLKSQPLRSFIFHIFAWCHELTRRWAWHNPESLVKAMIRFYNANGMEEIFHAAKQRTGDFPKFFATHDTWDLDVEDGDTDFVICLKMVAYTMEQRRLLLTQSTESEGRAASRMRSFVFSLCPNAGRTLRGDHDILASDVAMLVNRCSLYAIICRHAPEGCKPRFQQIENMVDMSLSHESASKVMLETWVQLVRHTLLFDSDYTFLEEVVPWVHKTLRQMLLKHEGVEQEVIQQLHVLSIADIDLGREEGNAIITANRKSVCEFVVQVLNGWRKCLLNCRNDTQRNTLFDLATSAAMVVLLAEKDLLGEQVSIAALQVLQSFITSVSNLSGRICSVLHDYLKPMLSQRLHAAQDHDSRVLMQLTQTWCDLAGVSVRNRLRSWDDYLDRHGAFAWENLGETDMSNQYKILFLAYALECDASIYFNTRSEVIGFWVSALVRPNKYFRFENYLSAVIVGLESSKAGDIWYSIRDVSIRGSIHSLRDNQLWLVSEIVWALPMAFRRELLSSVNIRMIVQALTRSLKKHWNLVQGGLEAHSYTQMMWNITSQLERSVQDICPIDSTFTDDRSIFAKPDYVGGLFLQKKTSDRSAISLEQVYRFWDYCIAKAIRHDNQLLTEFAATYCDSSPQARYDFKLQSMFLQDVLGTYVQLAFTGPAHALLNPVLETVVWILENISERTDNASPETLVRFASSCFGLVVSVRKCLQSLQPFEMKSDPFRYTAFQNLMAVARAAIVRYDTVRVLGMRIGLDCASRIQVYYQQMTKHTDYLYLWVMYTDNILRAAYWPRRSVMPQEEIGDDNVWKIAESAYRDDFGIRLNQRKPTSLHDYALELLSNSLLNDFRLGHSDHEYTVTSGTHANARISVAVTDTGETEWNMNVLPKAGSFLEEIHLYAYGTQPYIAGECFDGE